MVQGFNGGVDGLLTGLAVRGELADHGVVVHAEKVLWSLGAWLLFVINWFPRLFNAFILMSVIQRTVFAVHISPNNITPYDLVYTFIYNYPMAFKDSYKSSTQ